VRQRSARPWADPCEAFGVSTRAGGGHLGVPSGTPSDFGPLPSMAATAAAPCPPPTPSPRRTIASTPPLGWPHPAASRPLGCGQTSFIGRPNRAGGDEPAGAPFEKRAPPSDEGVPSRSASARLRGERRGGSWRGAHSTAGSVLCCSLRFKIKLGALCDEWEGGGQDGFGVSSFESSLAVILSAASSVAVKCLRAAATRRRSAGGAKSGRSRGFNFTHGGGCRRR
jgi:hypothetical protein